MATYKKPLYQEGAQPDPDISSMVDVCFLLLIYFLAVASIVPRESDLKLALPVPTEAQVTRPPIESLHIRVDGSGFVFSGKGNGEQSLDTQPDRRELPVLSSQLELYAAASRSAGSTPHVSISVDTGVTQQRVVDVLNAIALAKITTVTFTDLVDKT